MINVYPMLRQYMIDNYVTYKELAVIAGISEIKIRLSLCGLRRWRMVEAIKICQYFQTNKIDKMFLRNHFKPQ